MSLAACAAPQNSDQRSGAVQSTAEGAANVAVLTPEERAAGWRALFDGKSTAGWRGYRRLSSRAARCCI
jgi:hypothetical protein